MRNIGITTTVPIEVLIAAGYNVIDLNNIFISTEMYAQDIERAERDGFPKSSCAWIKGIYGACLRCGISEIVGVVEGDCSNTRALLEVLKGRGIKVHNFSYPPEHTLSNVNAEINRFMENFDVSLEQVEAVRKELNEVRHYAKIIDELTYIDNKATGLENHISQVSMSDFATLSDSSTQIEINTLSGTNTLNDHDAPDDSIMLKDSEMPFASAQLSKSDMLSGSMSNVVLNISGSDTLVGIDSTPENNLTKMDCTQSNPAKCKNRLLEKIHEIRNRTPKNDKLRLGYIGVPPMTSDIYSYVESFEASFVYNEVQREFAFPRAIEAQSIYEQYYDYTYPYDLTFRLKEICKQIELRRLDGIIHYTQSFCHRAIEDIVIKEALDIPVLTIEGDKSNCLDSRTKLRIEAFLDMLMDLKFT